MNQLRQIFKVFHPSWNNLPADANSFDRGQLMFEYADQEALFNAGDISKWDLSLMINVVLYSAVSGRLLRGADPKYNGFKRAIRGIQLIRNKFIAHAAEPSLSEDDYHQIGNDAVSHLLTLGADKEELDGFFAGEVLNIFKIIYFDLLRCRKVNDISITKHMGGGGWLEGPSQKPQNIYRY